MVALDGEVANSTYSEIFQKAHPDRFVEAFIAEQQMVADAVGLQVRGWYPFVSTFAAFLTRAYDFVRMAAVSRARLSLCGSHAGVSIGEDGPSQMGLEDLGMLRAVHGSTVLYPCDANQTAKLVAAMADVDRASPTCAPPGPTPPVIYGPDEGFEIGGSTSSAVRRRRGHGRRRRHHPARGAQGGRRPGRRRHRHPGRRRLLDQAHRCRRAPAGGRRDAPGRVVTVEDHWPEGGLGDAVLSAFAGVDAPPRRRVVKLAVTDMPTSGKPDELLAAAGIDAAAIVDAVRTLVAATERSNQ